MQIRLFHKWIIEYFANVANFVLVVFTVVIIYIPKECQFTALKVLICVLCFSYIVIVVCANSKKRSKITIHNTKIVVKSGDLFKERGLKVIPMNEYFDVELDNGIIDPNSLHGQYLKNYSNEKSDELYKNITTTLNNKNLIMTDEKRPSGNKNQYKLGTIYDDKNGFLLLAYSRFDYDNRARLHNDDIVQCYTNMWNEIDIIRGTNSIAFPVLGAGGLVRFDKTYTPQQLIELLIWSFRISGIQLSRGATLTIAVHDSIIKEVDFLKLKNYSD